MKRELDQREYLETRIDRSTFKIFNSFAEADAADRAYWHSRTPEERVRHAQYSRQLIYGSRATARLQRVLEVVTRRTS